MSNKTHGMASTKIYAVWKSEKQRCNNPENTGYYKYGGIGVKISKEFDNFSVWYEYVKSLPNAMKAGYSIDRKNNNGDYTRGNLRWATKATQARNTRRLREDNTTGYRGVGKINRKWRARIRVDGKGVHLGYFNYPWTAAIAYDSYVIIHQLEHTRNFKEIA